MSIEIFVHTESGPHMTHSDHPAYGSMPGFTTASIEDAHGNVVKVFLPYGARLNLTLAEKKADA